MIYFTAKKFNIPIIVLFLFTYLLSAILPFVEHKEVSEDFKQQVNAKEFYSNETGTERVAYVKDNVAAMVYRLQMINEAKEEILLSTFDFNADESGKALMSAMLHAADRGVKVRILVDGFSGLLDLNGNKWFQAFASHKNVTIKIYNPINLLKPWKLQARLHDKYLVIDDRMYLLGGRNTSNLFLGDYSSSKNIDRELFVYETKTLEQTSLTQLKEYFEKVWSLSECKEFKSKQDSKDTKEYMELRKGYDTLPETYPILKEKPNWLDKTMETNQITLISNPIEAVNKEPKLWYTLNQLMLTGKEIIIHTPYVICGSKMYEDLTKLCQSADSVEIITNDVTSGANPWGCTDYLNQKKNILKTGVKIYEFLGEYSNHTKSILVDQRISVVGSYNLDMRSTYLDTELMLVVDSEELNSILTAEAENDMTYSKSIEADKDYEHGSNYVEREVKTPKKLTYALLRLLIIPIRRLL